MPRLQELSTLSYLEEALSNRHVPPKTSTWEREMSLGHQCEFGTYRLRIRTVEGSDDEVVIHEDLSLISTRVWDCSVLVAKWLENIATRYQETPDLASALDLPLTSSTRDRPLNVLELGAGTGLLSVCLAKMGAAVLSTEYGVSVKYLQQNIDLNKIADSQSTRQMKWTPKSGVVSCRELDWYNASETLETLFAEGHQSVFDMIVVTDCSLTRRDSQGFMEMIHKYGTKNYTKVILGLCHEREGTPYCVENVPKEFRDVVKISEEAWHPDFKSQRHMIFTFKA
eukprot:scaffold3956_cov99-Cylindrotheca_fusiformis.AAC.5